MAQNNNPNRIDEYVFKQCLEQIAKDNNVRVEQIISQSRIKELAIIRNYIMTILYYSNYTIKDIVKYVGRINHTTVVNGVKASLGEIKYIKAEKERFEQIKHRLFLLYKEQRHFSKLDNKFILWEAEELKKAREEYNATA